MFELITFILAALSVAPCAFSQDVPAAEDSPVYKAFNQLKTQSSYRVTINMEVKDPRMAQMAAMGMGMSAIEKLVQGNTTQVVMHMKMPAMDIRGQIDDWEFRAVVKDGHAARLITSPAVPRLLKLSDQMFDMQVAMLEKQAATTVAQGLASGPVGALSAALSGTAQAANLAVLLGARKKSREMFSWQCLPQAGQGAEKTTPQFTDLRAMEDQKISDTDSTVYEFKVRENGNSQGPIRLLVAKASGLPLRIEMNDPGGRGSMHMDYTDFNKPAQIEIPDCLSK